MAFGRGRGKLDLDDRRHGIGDLAENSRQTCACAPASCARRNASVMRPSQPSFCTPAGRTELVGHVLAQTCLRKRARISRFSAAAHRPAVGAKRVRRKRAASHRDFATLWPILSTRSHSASGVTIFHDTRLSIAVPQHAFFRRVHRDVATDAGGIRRCRVHREHAPPLRRFHHSFWYHPRAQRMVAPAHRLRAAGELHRPSVSSFSY